MALSANYCPVASTWTPATWALQGLYRARKLGDLLDLFGICLWYFLFFYRLLLIFRLWYFFRVVGRGPCTVCGYIGFLLGFHYKFHGSPWRLHGSPYGFPL